MTFVDPKEDIAFKKIFGDERHPQVLKSFINAVLGLQGQEQVDQLKLLNPNQAPELKGLKNTIVDVQAQDKRGFKFIVEMQVERDEHFAKRALYYSSKAYCRQIATGASYSKLNPVYFIGVLDFPLLEGEQYLSRHLILNQATGKQELKDLVWNFIELPKFKLKEPELNTVEQKWIYFLKHAASLSKIPVKLSEESSIREAFEIANQYSWSEEDLMVYDFWSMREGIRRNNLRTARNTGFTKGFAQGEQAGFSKGEEKKALSIANKMKEQGIDTKTIAELTGLSLEQLNNTFRMN